MVLDSLCSKRSSSLVRTMKDMRHFLLRRLTEKAPGVRLMVPVEELITNTNEASRELPTPPPETQGESVDSLKAWSPVNIVRRRYRSIMVALPVVVDPGLEEGLIAVFPIQRRLLQT